MEIKASGKAPELYTKLKTKFLDYKSQGKLKTISNIDWNDAACTALASGTGFKATIACKDDRVTVDLELNFLLKAMRGQIEEGIHKMVGKVFS